MFCAPKVRLATQASLRLRLIHQHCFVHQPRCHLPGRRRRQGARLLCLAHRRCAWPLGHLSGCG